MLNYYHLVTKNNIIFKGESDKEFKNFGFYIKKEGEIYSFKGEIGIKNYEFSYILMINFEKSKILFSSIDNIKFNWEIEFIKNDFTRLLIDNNHKIISLYFNELNKKFYEIKKPFKYLLMKIIYRKIFFVENLFNNIKEILINTVYHSQLIILKSFFNENFKLYDLNSNFKELNIQLKRFIETFSINLKENVYDLIQKIKNILSQIIEQYNEYLSNDEFYYDEKRKGNKYILIIRNSFIFIAINDQSIHLDKSNLEIKLDSLELNSCQNSLSYINKDFIYYIENKNVYIGEIDYNRHKNGFGLEFIKESSYNDKIHSYYYIGNYSNNKFNSIGILNNPFYSYIGEFSNLLKQGKCIIYSKKDDSVYKGDINNNIIEGNGIYKTDKYIFEGEFKNNTYHGKGNIVFDNNDQFIGEFLKGDKSNGKYLSKQNFILFKYNQGNEIEAIYNY